MPSGSQLSSPPELEDRGAQPERTALAWLRTAASITFAALLIFRYLIEVGSYAQAYLLAGSALLLAPCLAVVGHSRSRQAAKNWPNRNLANYLGTLLVALAVSGFGLLSALFVYVAGAVR